MRTGAGPRVANAGDKRRTDDGADRSCAEIAPLGWLVFVELPLAEAFAPVYASILATGLVLLGGLIFAVRGEPVPGPQDGHPDPGAADRSGSDRRGALGHRIDIKTGDELQALGDQFNNMAAQLQDSYATLERKVEERTHQLELANLAKSRFLAAASHDLRQPLHASICSSRNYALQRDREHGRIVERIDAAVAAMNELFNALLRHFQARRRRADA